MHKCPELRKLPKAPHKSSINFRRQTPGSVNGLWQISTRQNRVDRNHPIDLLPGKPKAFLWAPPCNAFTLGATPIGLLLRPDDSSRKSGFGRTSLLYDAQSSVITAKAFDSWDARLARGAATGTVAPMVLNESHHTRISMSLQMHSTRELRTHHRVQILRRVKTALCLIATRGAAAKEVNGRLRLVFDEADAARGWILPGWTYYLRPGLELFKMPYPELVNLLRPTLRDLWMRGTTMEDRFTAAALGKHHTRLEAEPSKKPYLKAESRPSRSSTSKSTQSSTRPVPNRQKHAHSESDMTMAMAMTNGARMATIQADSRRGKDERGRDPVSPDLLPVVPDFDPFPAVRGTPPAASAPTGRTSPQLAPPVKNVAPRASLPPEPDFDPFPTFVPTGRASTLTAPASVGAEPPARQALPRAKELFPSIPLDLTLSPTHTAAASTSGSLSANSVASTSSPNPYLSRKAKPKLAEPVDWWGVGRKIEEAIGYGEEGATRWDVPQSSLVSPAAAVPKKKTEKERESTESRLARMLYQRDEVVRPNSQDRAARRIPWQTHRFEQK
ncbi:hypothetical protein K438DRAFT_1813369 [Mycena galopus ATCC 62051]|nr:hypothetical protein K438DRAFT_1813369 [Mycena galopus ATCC 62051]